MKYTDEIKEKALTMMKEDGVSKTCEAMKITKATLYKWRNEGKTDTAKADTAKAAPKAKKPRAKKAGVSKKANAAKAVVENAAENARALLNEDDGLAAKLAQVEAENSRLRERNAKLKQALAALLD